MHINKNMKAGYQGKPDAMREKAERLLNHPGSAKDVYFSKSAADFEKMRGYKEGGSVRKEEDKEHKMRKEREEKREEERKREREEERRKEREKYKDGGLARSHQSCRKSKKDCY
jgi:hypothetical protein